MQLLNTVEPRCTTTPLLRPLFCVPNERQIISLFYNLVNPTTPFLIPQSLFYFIILRRLTVSRSSLLVWIKLLDFSWYNMRTPLVSLRRVSQGGPCIVPLFPSKIALCSHVPTLSECFRTVIFRILFPCSQKLANIPLFPSIFCQCSLVPQNPWETLTTYLHPVNTTSF